MKNIFVIIALVLACAACDDWESEIQVVNKLPGAVMRNIQWGTLPLSGKLLPGQESSTITISRYSYYDKLPADFRLQFYIEVNGERVYVETEQIYHLGKDEALIIEISDTTKVYNPLLKQEENE